MKKAMYTLFFNCRGETVQVAIPHGKTVTGKLYRRLVMKKFENYVKKSRPRLGLQSLTILHDNAPAHTSKETIMFLEKKGLTILPHPPYSPDLAPCDFFLFPRLKKTLKGRRYHSGKLLGRQCFSSLRVYLRKTTRTLSINGLKDLNFAFVQRGSNMKGCTRILR